MSPAMYINQKLFEQIVSAHRDLLPAYVYDLDVVKSKYNQIKSMFASYENTDILYAMKANWNRDIVRTLCDEGAGLDTVSPAEIYYARKLGVDCSRMMFNVNNMTEADMHEVHKLGVLFSIGSLDELEMYGKHYPGDSICIRFNPLSSGVGAGEHEFVQTSGKDAKFGILLEHKNLAAAIVKKYNLKVVGVHKHTGSCIIEKGVFIQAVKGLLSVVKGNDFPDLQFVDFGGGFYVRYKDADADFDYQGFADEVIGLVEETNKALGKKLQIKFEPGKFLSAECGYLVAEVTSVKDNGGYKIAGTNSGMNHLMRPVLYGAHHEVFNISNPGGTKYEYDVVGNICESSDFFAKRRAVPEIRKGDFLAIGNAGGYVETMSSFYNMRQLPSVLVIRDGKVSLTRKRIGHAEMAELVFDKF